MDFNIGWEFFKEKEENKKIIVNLPHDAMITEKRDYSCHNGSNTAYFCGGKYVYRKTFTLPTEYKGKYISLLFEGVYRNAKVFLNNKLLEIHPYGYTEFETPLLNIKFGQENIIEVYVDNSLEPNSRWYSGSGIYRPVTLLIRDNHYIKDIKIVTKEIDPVVINVQCSDMNADVKIFDGDKLISNTKCGNITLKNVKLWSDTNPYLYHFEISNTCDKEELDFGFRIIKLSSESGLTINGIETKLRGVCLHHDNGILGACAFKDAIDRKVRIVKESGYNAIRSAHNPCSRAMLDACDKYGVILIDESFDMWYNPKTYHDYARVFKENYHMDLRTMVEKDFNHPSVFFYSIGNELCEIREKRGIELAKEIESFIKSIDDTRFVTMGINCTLAAMNFYNKESKEYKPEPLPNNGKVKVKLGSSALFNEYQNHVEYLMNNLAKSRKCTKILDNLNPYLDVIGLNYGSARYDIDNKKHPDRIYFGSETMAKSIYYNWNRVMKYKQLIGDFVWAGFDYLGETCEIGAWRYTSWKGMHTFYGCSTIDVNGRREAQNYYQQVIFGTYKKPYMCVRPINMNKEKMARGGWRMTNAIDSWSYDGYDGEKAIIEVYTTQKYVKLLLNDKLIATKKTKKGIAMFKTKYHNGTLRAIVYDEKLRAIDEAVLQTASKETILNAVPDKTTLHANYQDLCYVEISLTDENGILKVLEDEKITVKVEGLSCELAALGSSKIVTDRYFNTYECETFQGRCLLILRATNRVGKTRIVVENERKMSKIFEIESI